MESCRIEGIVWGAGYVGDLVKLMTDIVVPMNELDQADLETAAL